MLKAQIERANEERKDILMMGDANICTNKWNNPQYKHHRVVMELRSGLEQNGMKNIDIGNTYLADNTTQNGKIAESALDHIYMSSGMEEKT